MKIWPEAVQPSSGLGRSVRFTETFLRALTSTPAACQAAMAFATTGWRAASFRFGVPHAAAAKPPASCGTGSGSSGQVRSMDVLASDCNSTSTVLTPLTTQFAEHVGEVAPEGKNKGVILRAGNRPPKN